MSAEIIPLQTDAAALWETWREARIAHMDHPSCARFDACIEAFKAWYLRLCGREGYEIALAREVLICNAFLIAAQQLGGGPLGRR